MGVLTQSVAVECTTAGMPLYLEWAGRRYVVATEPTRWYERRRWWAQERRAQRGRGPGLVDHEIWRIQVRPERANYAPLTTVDITRQVESGRWRLVRIHDGQAASDTEQAGSRRSA